MLEENLADCNSLDEVQAQTQGTLSEFHEDGFSIHYVAGPISADGEANIPLNLDKLIAARTRIMYQLGDCALVFTAPFIFTPEVYQRLGIFNMSRDDREAELQRFWDELILSGLIDGIHFVEGWQRSPGTQRERRTAEAAGVPVFDI